MTTTESVAKLLLQSTGVTAVNAFWCGGRDDAREYRMTVTKRDKEWVFSMDTQDSDVDLRGRTIYYKWVTVHDRVVLSFGALISLIEEQLESAEIVTVNGEDIV